MSDPKQPESDDRPPPSSGHSASVTGAMPKRSGPGMPEEQAKVQARPELVGQTEAGEPLLKLAAFDRRAPTQRGIDKSHIEAAVKAAKEEAARMAAAEQAAASQPGALASTDASDEMAARPVWSYLVVAGLLGLALAAVAAIKLGVFGGDAPDASASAAASVSAPKAKPSARPKK